MRSPFSILGSVFLALAFFLYFLLLGKTYKKERPLFSPRLGVLLSLALVFGIVESFLPDIVVPGVKLGLSNVVVLLVIYAYGAKEGLFLAILKAILVSFFAGTFLTMGGWMSLAGSTLSAVMMVALRKIAPKFSPIAVSSFGALCHFLGQMAIASVYLGAGVWGYAPLGAVLAVSTGIFTGAICAILLRQKTFLRAIGGH